MSGVASGAGADRTVRIGLANFVAGRTAFGNGGFTFEQRQLIGCAVHSARVILLGKFDLLSREIVTACHGCPGGGGMPAAEILRVLSRMALRTILGR